jgi:oxalate decarboxylase/phosphoglucose isomerase-like protein (cupin superfamily)
MTVHSNSALVPDVLPGLVQQGEGTLVFGGEERRFRAGDTIIVPPSAHHQIVNTGDVPLVLVAALSTANVVVRLPDGTPLELPWK